MFPWIFSISCYHHSSKFRKTRLRHDDWVTTIPGVTALWALAAEDSFQNLYDWVEF